MLSRRGVLAGSGVLGAATALGGGPAWAGARVVMRAEAVPDLQLVSPHPTADAVRLVFDETPLRFPAAAAAEITLRNTLGEPVGLRWLGLRGAGDAARVTGLTVGAGASRTFALTPKDSGTLLARAEPAVAQLAARGLQTIAIVSEAAAPPVDHDLPLLVADRLFAADGTPRFGSQPRDDARVAVMTVNGRPAPLEVEVAPRARLRLRLVNGSVRRLMLIACQGASPSIIAVDSQPSDLFTPARATLPVGPGARYDLMLDCPDTAGEEVRIVLKATERLGGALEAERVLVRLRTSGASQPARPPIVALPRNPALPVAIPLEAAKRADLTVAGTSGPTTAAPHGWTVNGVGSADATRPVLTVRRGEAVVLGVANTTPSLVPLNIGGHSVRLLHARDDGWDPYWRDTLLLPPGSRAHVAFVADTAGRWTIDSGFDDLTLAGLSCFYEVRPD